MCGNNNYKGCSQTSGDGLATVAKRLDREDATKWPTPMAEGDLHYRLGGNSQASKSLAAAVVFPTPCRDGTGGVGAKKHLRNLAQIGPDFQAFNNGCRNSLNPDWEEWLMFWPIGWTDLDTPNHRLVWYHPTFDPAAVTCEASASLPFIPRLTTRRKYRVARVKAIGNGQYPPTAFIMAEWGFEFLQLLNKGEK